jgi:hypothetical protein
MAAAQEVRMPTPSPTPPEDQRIVLYRGFAYRRLADGVSAAPPAGPFETVPAAALPLPVARALGVAQRADSWNAA